jgi:Ca-activated chloride channel family protein
MSADNNNHAPVSVEDFQDRLMDCALAELVVGRVPPDLSSRILDAHGATLNTPGEPTIARANRRILIRRASTALAATLLFVMTLAALILPTFNPNRPIAHETKITRMVEEFNRLETEKRYAESEILARDLYQLAPDDPVAQQTWNKAKLTRREMLNRHLASSEESSQWEQLNAVEKSTVAPLSDGREAVYDQKHWSQFTKERKKAKDGPDTTVSTTTRSSSAAPSIAPSAGPPNAAPSDRFVELYTSQPTPPNAPVAMGDRFELSGQAARAPKEVAPQPQSPSLPTPYYLTDDVHYSVASKDLAARGGRGFDSPQIVPQLREAEKSVFRSGDNYSPINENAFIKAIGPDAVSTFSIDVDTASYANVRQFLMETHQLPPANAVRIEELVNYFQYDYTPPKNDDEAPFAAHVEVAGCPWNSEHRLARIAVKGREMDRSKRPLSNLVFLVDVSGSMNEPAKLPLVVYGLEQLTRELGENDHIAIVVYAGSEGLALPSTSGSKQDVILATLAKLQAGGSTAGGAGINLAYQIAEDNFIKGGTNRVILCTDGDFNVGVTDTGELQKLVEKKAKDTGVFLSVLGFGRGNLNDAMMEAISNHGNGNYHYVDNRTEARRVLVEEMAGTLVTIAKDVKIQVEFNPAQVAAYRLIGYEDRMLKTEDFNDDKKDAGEIGAGHNVTALYEIVPAGKEVGTPAVDPLKYQKPVGRTILSDLSADKREDSNRTDKIVRPTDDASNELLTLKMRYKSPDGDTSKKLEWPITDGGQSYGEATDDFQFASAVAGFGLMLRDSQYKGDLTYAAVLDLAQSGIGADERGYRREFLDLVREAKKLKHE